MAVSALTLRSCFFRVSYAGTGTLTSPPAVTRSVWWCTTSHQLLQMRETSTCSSGMTTTVRRRTISSASTPRVRFLDASHTTSRSLAFNDCWEWAWSRSGVITTNAKLILFQKQHDPKSLVYLTPTQSANGYHFEFINEQRIILLTISCPVRWYETPAE